MNWQIFGTTFLTIFVAEMGDKTQFAAMASSAESKGAWEVLWAVIAALALAGALGFFAGKILSEFLSPQILKVASGSLFILMGLWILLKR